MDAAPWLEAIREYNGTPGPGLLAEAAAYRLARRVRDAGPRYSERDLDRLIVAIDHLYGTRMLKARPDARERLAAVDPDLRRAWAVEVLAAGATQAEALYRRGVDGVFRAVAERDESALASRLVHVLHPAVFPVAEGYVVHAAYALKGGLGEAWEPLFGALDAVKPWNRFRAKSIGDAYGLFRAAMAATAGALEAHAEALLAADARAAAEVGYRGDDALWGARVFRLLDKGFSRRAPAPARAPAAPPPR